MRVIAAMGLLLVVIGVVAGMAVPETKAQSLLQEQTALEDDGEELVDLVDVEEVVEEVEEDEIDVVDEELEEVLDDMAERAARRADPGDTSDSAVVYGRGGPHQGGRRADGRSGEDGDSPRKQYRLHKSLVQSDENEAASGSWRRGQGHRGAWKGHWGHKHGGGFHKELTEESVVGLCEKITRDSNMVDDGEGWGKGWGERWGKKGRGRKGKDKRGGGKWVEKGQMKEQMKACCSLSDPTAAVACIQVAHVQRLEQKLCADRGYLGNDVTDEVKVARDTCCARTDKTSCLEETYVMVKASKWTRKAKDSGKHWSEHVCAALGRESSQARWERKLAGLPREEASRWRERGERMAECCSMEATARVACFTSLKQAREAAVCAGAEPLSCPWRPVSEEEARAVRGACCTLTGDERSVCFKEKLPYRGHRAQHHHHRHVDQESGPSMTPPPPGGDDGN